MVKNNNHTTRTKKPTKKVKFKRKPSPQFGMWREWPLTKASVQRLADALVEWARKDDSLTLQQFWVERNITPKVYYDYKKKHECLQDAHEYAHACLGARREVGGLKRELDPGLVSRSMPIYSKEWKELEEWRNELKKKNEDKSIGTERIVVIERSPDSPLVKEKNEKTV